MSQHPLIVDLDGTMIRSDLLYESFARLLTTKPFLLLLVPFWLLRGIPYLKCQLANHTHIDIASIPLNMEFIEFLKGERENGRTIVLASACHDSLAAQFASELPIFDQVWASDGKTNLKGEAKLTRIREHFDDFDYAGDSLSDLAILTIARHAHVVNAGRRLSSIFKGRTNVTFWPSKSDTIRAWTRQLRIYQWIKNVLLFVPLLVAQDIDIIDHLPSVLLGFVAFGLLASSTYVFNDLLDIDADRRHPRKRNRPLAAGIIPIRDGIVVATGVFCASIILSAMLSPAFLAVVLIYLSLTLSYSVVLKRYVLIDAIVLACLYTIRVFAGAVLIGVDVSFWLLSFSMLSFLSLALLKRCFELKTLQQEGQESANGRDYGVHDYGVLQAFGVASAMMALLMFMFFVDATLSKEFYSEPQLLWLVLPAFVYLFMRLWLKASRSELTDDPIVFAATDRGSVTTVMFIVVVTLCARFL